MLWSHSWSFRISIVYHFSLKWFDFFKNIFSKTFHQITAITTKNKKLNNNILNPFWYLQIYACIKLRKVLLSSIILNNLKFSFENLLKVFQKHWLSFISVPTESILLYRRNYCPCGWQRSFKERATELQSHDAMLPVVTSASFFHLSLLLGGNCHIRRRIVAPCRPQVTPFFPDSSSWQSSRPIQRSVHQEHRGEQH